MSDQCTDHRGLSMVQEPKYTVNGRNLVNRISGEVIPDDEPVFILRGKDFLAIPLLRVYRLMVTGEHRKAVDVRLGDFKRFKQKNYWRMKIPDTFTRAGGKLPLPSMKQYLRRLWVIMGWRLGIKGEKCLCSFYEAAHYNHDLEWNMEDRPCPVYTPETD